MTACDINSPDQPSVGLSSALRQEESLCTPGTHIRCLTGFATGRIKSLAEAKNSREKINLI